MPGLMGESREVLVDRRWQSQPCCVTLRGQHVDRSHLSGSETLLRRVHRLLAPRTNVCAFGSLGELWGTGVICRAVRSLSVWEKKERKHWGKSSTGRLHETWDGRASVLVWLSLVSAVEITRGSAAALTVQAWFQVLLRRPYSECRLRPRSRSLWAHISCRSTTCSRSRPHERPPSCCPSSSCRPLKSHQKRNTQTSRFIPFLLVIIRCFNFTPSSSSEYFFLLCVSAAPLPQTMFDISEEKKQSWQACCVLSRLG